MRFRNLLRALACLGATAALQAIPAWSRLTGASCAACHSLPSWQLTESGLQFLAQGHRATREAFDASSQSFDNYVSVYWKLQASADQGRRPSTLVDGQNLGLYAGGALSARWSFMLQGTYTDPQGRAGTTDPGQAKATLAKAYLSYTAPLPGDGYLKIRGGKLFPELLQSFGAGGRGPEQQPLPVGHALDAEDGYRISAPQNGVDLKANWSAFEGAFGVLDSQVAGLPSNRKDLYATAQLNLDEDTSALALFHAEGPGIPAANPVLPGPGGPPGDFRRDGALLRLAGPAWRLLGAGFWGVDHLPGDPLQAERRPSGWYGMAEFKVGGGLWAYLRADQNRNGMPDARLRQGLLGVERAIFATKKSAARWNLEFCRRQEDGTWGNGLLLQLAWTL